MKKNKQKEREEFDELCRKIHCEDCERYRNCAGLESEKGNYIPEGEISKEELYQWHIKDKQKALAQKEEEVRREVLKSYFTQAELNQLIAYAEYRDEHVDEGGWYYGNQKHFEKRHKSIIEKLQSLTKK